MGLHKLKFTFVSIGFIWVSFSLAVNAAKGYKDVPNGHWAKNSVVKVVDEYQFMAGDPNGNFGGSRALSRYEFAKTLSNMIEYYNREIETDRKDLENVVGVLELFQTEMKKMETKVAEANQQVESQNKTIAELNELVVTVADELNGVNAGSSTQEQLTAIKDRVALAEENIDKLGDKGLIVDTLIKGVGNDAKHLGHAIANVAKKTTRHNNLNKVDTEEPAAVVPEASAPSASSNVEAELAAPAQESSAKPVEETHSQPTTTQQQTQEFINSLDGYYAAPSGQVEYLTPVH